jgi:hypothetical protein
MIAHRLAGIADAGCVCSVTKRRESCVVSPRLNRLVNRGALTREPVPISIGARESGLRAPDLRHP